jgi:hypothetical protein
VARAVGWPAGSSLYAVPFQVTDSVVASATLALYYSVDNAINGVFFNGMRISGNSYDGDYHGEYHFIRTDIAPLLIPNATNWLYLNVSDYGGLSALLFSATITINGATAGAQSISPDHGGNAGRVSVRVIGSGFQPGAQLKLAGIGPDIFGTNTTVVTGNILTATLDLTGAMPGLRNVIVTNPDLSFVTVPSGFNVEVGGAPDIRIHKIGTPAVLGRNSTYYITAENVGTVDASSTDILELLDPSEVILQSVTPAPNAPISSLAPASLVTWTVPNLGAGQTQTFSYTVQVYSTVPLSSTIHGSVCISPSAADAWSSCAFQLAKTSLICTACVVPCGITLGCPVVAPACLATAALCAQCLMGAPNGIPSPFQPGGCGYNAYQLYQCMTSLPSLICTSTSQTPRGSVDPNGLIGPSGAGVPKWISGTESIQYIVLFENLPTATKSATEVTVTDIFDGTTFDLSALTVGPISFGNSTYIPPALPLAVNPFSADVDLRPGQNLIVRVSAALNAVTSQITMQFVSINPATGLPPSDPLVGFLPPGVGGSVLFTVRPKSGIATGTTIQNQAIVVFDQNPAISTQTWSNTIDNTPPTSKLSTLPVTESTYSFPVQWSGTDVGSGIQDFTIYVSDNGAPFKPWLTNTAATQALYTGTGGHTYAFYSIARDLVGNVEASKTGAEGTTLIVVDTTPPIIVPQITGTLGKNGWYTSSVTVSWSFSDPESGIASSTGCTQTTLTNEIAGVTLSCSAINGAGLSTTVSLAIKIDKTPPAISGMPAQACSLWPPNGKLVQVSTVTAADALSGLASGSFQITGTSNEPSSDPNNAEIVITPNGSGGYGVYLQAARLGTGSGRVYTLTATASDLAGNTATVVSTCTVPHDQGN